MISVILVEDKEQDRELITNHLKQYGDFTIIKTGHDAYDALQLIQKYKPDIALINLKFNFYNEIEVSHLLKRTSPGTSIVLISRGLEGQMLKKSIDGQVSAYLLNDDLENLAIILRKVKNGEMYINNRIGIWAINALAKANSSKPENKTVMNDLMSLSRKEVQLVNLVSMGHSDREISDILSLKGGTVRNYVSGVMKKTGTKNRSQLVRYAISTGISRV